MNSDDEAEYNPRRDAECLAAERDHDKAIAEAETAAAKLALADGYVRE